MDITFRHKLNEVEDIWSFVFEKPPGFTFDAGDYVELALEYGEDKLGGRRWFTIASAPYENTLQFTMVIPRHSSDYKSALMRLLPGSTATVSPAIGTFNLSRNPDNKTLWIAGGIGVTPYRSMARQLINSKEERSICMLYVAKPHKFLFQPELRTVCAQLETSNQRPSSDQIPLLFPDWKERKIYLSGPQNFCESIYGNLRALGAAKSQLNLDYFPGYSQL